MEKVFPSNSKIRAVYAFVRDSLREDVKPVKFVLCRFCRIALLPAKLILIDQPPKRDLKVSDPAVRDLTLSELYLAPSSVLLLRFEDGADEEQARALNGVCPSHSSRLSLTGKIGSRVSAPLAPEVLSQAIDLPMPPAVQGSAPTNSGPNLDLTSVGASLEKKIPKWLKVGLSTFDLFSALSFLKIFFSREVINERFIGIHLYCTLSRDIRSNYQKLQVVGKLNGP